MTNPRVERGQLRHTLGLVGGQAWFVFLYSRKQRRDGFLLVLSLVVHPIVHVAASGRFVPGPARRAAESIRASGRVFFRNERQEGWLEDLESTFRHFGRVTNEIPFDNDRGFVSRRAVATREVTLTRDFWPSLEGSGHGPPLRLPDNVAREATGGAVS